jgi:site-specific recombinase XerD
MKSTIETAPSASRRDESGQKLLTDALNRYLVERGYSRHTMTAYVSHAGHFLRWTTVSRHDFCRLDETSTARFLQERYCRC